MAIEILNHPCEKIVIKIMHREDYRCVSFQPYILKKDIWVESQRGFVVDPGKLGALKQAITEIEERLSNRTGGVR